MTGIDLARAILTKLERDRQVPTVLPATVVGLDDDPEAQPIPLAHVEVDGNPPGMVNVIPIATAGRLAIGQRVLVHFDPPSGAYIIGTITRPAGGAGRPYATIVVAASNSVAADKAAADIVCPGVDDTVLIGAVLDTLEYADPDLGVAYVGGRVLLLEGDYFGSGGAISIPGGADRQYPQPTVELAGMGPASRLVFSGSGYGVYVGNGRLANLALLCNDDDGTGVTPFYLGSNGSIRHVVVGWYSGFVG